MPTFLDILGTSTPVSEVLAQKLGYVKAAIVCRIFFYEQLEHKVCEASIGTIAQKLGMSTGAVSTNINWLLAEKYIKVIGKYRKGGSHPNKFKVAKRFYVEIQRSADESQRSADEIKRREKEESKEVIPQKSTKKAMFENLAEIYKIDIKLFSRTQKTKVITEADKLIEARKNPDDVKLFEKWWYKHDWRGQKGQPPQPFWVSELWGQFEASKSNNGQKPANNPLTPEQAARARELTAEMERDV